MSDFAALLSELHALDQQYPLPRDAQTEVQILYLRRSAAQAVVAHPESDSPAGDLVETSTEHAEPPQPELPTLQAASLSADALAGAFRSGGGALVRGFLDADEISMLRDQLRADQSETPESRESIAEYGCSPAATNLLVKVFHEKGFTELLCDYFQDQPLMVAERTKLRRRIRGRDNFAVIPWHQDVNFFGHRVGGLGVWCALEEVGEDVHGLSVVPHRFTDRIGWSGEGHAPLNYGKTTGAAEIEQVIGQYGKVTPVLNPGDAILLDEMTLHATAPRPWTAEEQLVAISWFFPASRFPRNGTPLAL